MSGVAGRTFSAHTIRLRFNTRPDDWVLSLKATAAHEFAHAWHYEQRGETTTFVWQHVLDEAITQNFAEHVYPDYETPWRRRHSNGKIAGFWSDVKARELDRRIDEVGRPIPLYINDSDQVQYPNWLGYSMSYLLGKELLEARELEEMPSVSRQELVDAGDRLFAKA